MQAAVGCVRRSSLFTLSICWFYLHFSCMLSLILGWTGVNERTFIAVKPDGVQRKLVGEIIRRFEKKGFKLVGLKLVQVFQLSAFYSPLRLISQKVLKITANVISYWYKSFFFYYFKLNILVLCVRQLRIILGNTTGTWGVSLSSGNWSATWALDQS